MKQPFQRIMGLFLAAVMLLSCVLPYVRIQASATEQPGEPVVSTETAAEPDNAEDPGDTGENPSVSDGENEAPAAIEETGEHEEPSGENTETGFMPRMFRWELNEEGNELVSVESDDLTKNELELQEGTISGGTLNHVRLALTEALELRPDQPWSIEWCANGNFAQDDLLFSNNTPITTNGNFYIYRQNGGISIGKYDGRYHNCGITFTGSGYNDTIERTFRIINQINEDGSNTVSLYIDGNQIGTFNQATDWLNGATLRFQYLGADGGTDNGFRLHGSGLKYLLVNEGRDHKHTEVTIPAVPATFRETGLTEGTKCLECGEILVAQKEIPMLEFVPRMFRWVLNAEGSELVNSEGTALTQNLLTKKEGSISNGTFNSVRYALAEPLELRPNHAWSIEWRASGNWAKDSFPFSAEETCNTSGNIYLFRQNNNIYLGMVSDGYKNFGVSVDQTPYNDATEHTYRLTNDASTNQISLYVDNNLLGVLNKNTTDLVSGKTFQFAYLGADSGFELKGSGFKYLMVDEGTAHEHTPVTIPAVPPEGTQNGLTEGSKCSGCGLILKEQEEVLASEYNARMFCWTLNTDGNALVNSTGDLLTNNDLTLQAGKILDGTFTGVQLSLAQPLELRYNQPWSIEWRSTGTWAANSLLFSTTKENTTSNNLYIYRPSAFVSLGVYENAFQNYAASLEGCNDETEHTFRLVNQFNADGTNMVYLYVDNNETGIPLNQHYTANTLQNPSESNWVSGKTFQFAYIGAAGHLVSGSGLKYLLVNEGKAHDTHNEEILPGKKPTETEDGLTEGKKCAECGAILVAQEVIPVEARMFRWDNENSTLESQTGDRYTENTLTQTGSGFTVKKPVILRHNQSWSIAWSGVLSETADLLFSADASATEGSRYLYRSKDLIALGVYENGQYQNYGVSLAGIDTTVSHTYRLSNRVAADGTNMVWLYVDNQEIGALNNNKANTWISGRDFRFGYIGTTENPVTSKPDYIWVNEGIAHDHVEEIIPGIPAGEKTAGLSDGKRCSVCGDILVAQQVVAPLRESRLQAALLGKTLSILGDDISTYDKVSNSTDQSSPVFGFLKYYPTGDVTSADMTWWKQAADNYSMSVLVNNSYSGSFVSSTTSMGQSTYGWASRPGNLGENPDIIAIYMGANDLMADVPCGTTPLDEDFYAKIQAEGYEPETNNFGEAAALMVYKVVTHYPNAKVFLFNLPVMKSGETITDPTAYNNILKQLADHYKCTLVDLYSSAMKDCDTNTSDGIHPNAAGMDVMTDVFADALYERLITNATDNDTAATARGVFLSDLNYIPSGTNIGHGTYKKDSNPSGEKIQLRVDGATVTFDKGIGAHAPSTVTFNISQYNQGYPRFTAKVGVDAGQGSKGSVIFKILGSNVLTAYGDNTGWTELLVTDRLTAASNAVEVDIDVSKYTYLRLYADASADGNGNDHSVYADARLVKADFDIDAEYFPRLHSLKWYDEQLSQQTYAHNLENNLRLIQEREFVNRLGITTIQHAVKDDDTMDETLNWLLDDPTALQLFLETGNILAPANTLKYLDILYTEYENLMDTEVYKKMLIALAISWANDRVLNPIGFGGGIMGSIDWYFDILARYEAVKWVYDQGYMHYGKDVYASYNMELMRMLVADYIEINEVKWVQAFAKKKYPDNTGAWTGPYRFMSYVKTGYRIPEFYDPEKWKTYDEKYDLTINNIPRSDYNDPHYRIWMVYEAGGICWNISRIGQTLNKSYGIPAVAVFQPGHEAYFVYSENANGQGLWSIGNNVGGWVRAYNNWGGTASRLLLGWGSNTAYAKPTNNSGCYIVLAQAAMNRFAEFQQSSYLNILADAYADPKDKLEIYQASLNALNLNLDTYLDIIALYKEMGEQITSAQWEELAYRIISAYTYYPVPMVDLLDAIEPHLTNPAFVNNAKTTALNKAKVATESDVLQSDVCRVMAASMLGQSTDDVLATFSFDGENAGCIVLGASYEGSTFQLQYSLDGGKTWLTYNMDEANRSRIIKLTDEQLASINATDDIIMYISGMPVGGDDMGDLGDLEDTEDNDVTAGEGNLEGDDTGDTSGETTEGGNTDEEGSTDDTEIGDTDYFTIDILEGTAPVVETKDSTGNGSTEKISIHDGENWIVGKTTALEFSTDNGATWKLYDHEKDRFHGNQTVLVRYAAHGTTLACSETATLTFTGTNESEKFQHISVSEVTLVRDNGTTYYQGRTGEMAIDANPFTGWHSESNQLEENKQIVVEFAKVKQLAGITYKAAGDNGRFLGVEIYVSMDDNTWTEVGSADWANDDTMKTVTLQNTVAAKYVKLQATTNNGFICAQDIDFFEDPTAEIHAASIHYSTTSPTNGNVTASLILDSNYYTASGETSFEFTENGTHVFTYTDKVETEEDGSQAETISGEENGVQTYTLTAHVTWIDKTAPTAAVSYSTTDVTDNSVTATLTFDEEVTVNGGAELVLTHEYVFTANGTADIAIVDAAGNAATIPLTVNWIRPSGNAATFSFDGTNAGQIVLDMFYAKRAVDVIYSLDGGSTTQPLSLAANAEKVIALTKEQLWTLATSADIENEIRVTVNLTGSETDTATAAIDLAAAPAAPVVGSSSSSTQIAMHDGENWILGKTAGLEYSTDALSWHAHDADTRFLGAQTVKVRYAGQGLTRPSAVRELTFTADEKDFTYIPIRQVRLVSASNGQYYNSNKGEYALDGDPFTYWHSASGSPREITVEFETVKLFAGFAYERVSNSHNGRVKDVEVKVSLDGQTWDTAGSADDWPENNDRKVLKLEKPVSAKFVKLVGTHTYGQVDVFMAANTLDFYEDTTQVANVTVGGATTSGSIAEVVQKASETATAGKPAEITLKTEFDHENHSSLVTEVIREIAKIDNNANIVLTLDASDGSVTFNAKAIRDINDKAATDAPIVLHVDDVTETSNHVSGAAATYEITMTQGDTPLFPVTGEETTRTATVTIPRPAGVVNPVVYHVANGTKTLLESTVGAGTISFITSHFSTFTVEEAVAETGSKKYATLSEAIAAAKSGETITIIAATEITAEEAEAAFDKGVNITKVAGLDIIAPDGYEWDGSGKLVGINEVTVEYLTWRSATLELKDAIFTNYYFNPNIEALKSVDFALNGTNAGLQMWTEAEYNALTLENGEPAKDAKAGETFSIVDNGDGRWRATTNPIPAKNMGDLQYVRGYIVVNGVTYYTTVKSYSPAIYARNRLNNSDDAGEKNLMVALMDFGVAAQHTTQYNVEQPMNSFLTEAHKQFRVSYNSNMLTACATDTSKFGFTQDSRIEGRSRTLDLTGALNINIYYNIDAALMQASTEAKLLYWNESDYQSMNTLNVDNCSGAVDLVANGTAYGGKISGIAAKDLKDTYYACVYIKTDAGAIYGGLTSYSAHQYAINQMSTQQELCQAMAVYSHTARAFLVK